MGFTLRLPFRVPPPRFIGQGRIAVGSLEMQLGFKRPWHILQVSGLETEASAADLLHRLEAALLWVGLESHDGIEFSTELQDLDLDRAPPPDAVALGAQAMGHEGLPSIYPDNSSVAFAMAMPLRVRVDMPLGLFSERLRSGLERSQIGDSLKNSRLRFALDIFLSSYFENSVIAQFLTRVTVLEILKMEDAYPDEIMQAVERWQQEVVGFATSGVLKSPQAESLKGQLERLKKHSIGFGIRDLVAKQLGPERAQKAVRLYTLRSDLVHEGSVTQHQVSVNLPDLTDLVSELLRKLLLSSSA
jgi:hypothetical protein